MMAETQTVSTDRVFVHLEDSWGIGNLRQTSGFPFDSEDKFKYVCPLGPLIVGWDIKKKEQFFSKQFADDLITILLRSEKAKLILMVTYCGQGMILNESFLPLCNFEIPGSNVVYACWSKTEDHFCVCNIGYNSSVSLFEVKAGGNSVVLKWSQKASDFKDIGLPAKEGEAKHDVRQKCEKREVTCSLQDINSSKNEEITAPKTRPLDCYYGCIFTDDMKILAIFRHDKMITEAHLFTLEGNFVRKQSISPLGESNTSMMCISECRSMQCAVGLQRGIFVFVNAETLELGSVFQAQGSAQVCIWDKDLIMTASYQSGVLQWWNVCGELVRDVNIDKIESIVHLNWSVCGKELWIGGITSLNYVSVDAYASCKEENEVITLAEHRVAGCGLNFKDECTLATGDLAGNVIIHEKGEKFSFFDNARVKLDNSVRCLAWVYDTLFIGTLEGMLFSWQPYIHDGAKSSYTVAYSFQFGVLTIRKANAKNLLAVGTGGGDLYVFDISTGNCELVFEKKLHDYRTVTEGMEKRPMEIWSTAWNPNDDMIVTASEDKTSVVVNFLNGEKIATIAGHTSAVTSVDWKTLLNGKCILASCADDRTVRINDGNTFKLLHVLQTNQIHGWYTLTYLSINPISNLAICSSQNGFLIIWDLTSLQCIFCKKLHSGSIEGLEWNCTYQNFATVGSDCVVNLASITI